MEWITTDYKGEPVTWFSQETINRIREMATAGVLASLYSSDYKACETILKFLNEVDK